MSPRRICGRTLTIVRMLAVAVAVLALIWAGGFLLDSSIGWMTGREAGSDGVLFRSAICGLIASLFIAVFHFKQETLRLPALQREDFLARIQPHLADLGYIAAATTTGDAVYRPAARSLLFGSGIRIAFANGAATVHGPRVYLEVLRRRLRVQGFVEHAERKRPIAPSERLLRRVEFGMRVVPAQWDAVNKQVIEVLRHAGAEVLCQVTILAKSDAGISEKVVDGEVQQWLRQEVGAAEVRKQPLSSPSLVLADVAREAG